MPSAQRYSITKYREKGQTLRMLFLWKGSVYRMIWDELFIWLVLYYGLNMIYRFVLNDEQRDTFEHVVTDVESGIAFIPLSFVLGFYVNIVVSRYWNMWDNLPRPDTLALRISASIRGKEVKDVQLRRTCVRYSILTIALAYRKISKPVMKLYPDLESLVQKGLLNEEEKELLHKAGGNSPPYWMPLTWVADLFETAREENRIKNDAALGNLLTDLANFRGSCGKTLQVDQIGIPLAYSQVVILALYTFSVGSIIARQSVFNVEISRESYFPIFTLLQLVILVGWMCVAESMIHPFGDDDDDFQLGWMIDNHISSAYKIVDTADNQQPTLTDDNNWEALRDEATSGAKRTPPSSPLRFMPTFGDNDANNKKKQFAAGQKGGDWSTRDVTVANIGMEKNPRNAAW